MLLFSCFLFFSWLPICLLKMCLVVQGARTQHLGTAHTHFGCCYAWFGLVMLVDHKAKLACIRTWVRSVCVSGQHSSFFLRKKMDWVKGQTTMHNNMSPPKCVCVCVGSIHLLDTFFLDSLEVGGRWSRWHFNEDPIWIRVVGGSGSTWQCIANAQFLLLSSPLPWFAWFAWFL